MISCNRRHVFKVRSFHACRFRWRDLAAVRALTWRTRVDFFRPGRLHLARSGKTA